jgi:hypothetical protein
MNCTIGNLNGSAAFTRAAGRMFFAFYPDLDNIGRSADPGIDHNGIRGTVGHTGATFHAGIEIDQVGLLVPHFKNRMGTDLGTQAAADAFFFVQD